MFFVSLEYTVPAAELEPLRPQHVHWLEEQYDRRLLLGSGRQVPRVGGLLLFGDVEPGAVTEALASEPFIAAGLATGRVIRFEPTRGPLMELGLLPRPDADANDTEPEPS